LLHGCMYLVAVIDWCSRPYCPGRYRLRGRAPCAWRRWTPRSREGDDEANASALDGRNQVCRL
ncbi:MAG TPA: hypothetical protein VLQ80_15405, partial [Candidatus Saccharimonadia bacterium]|nr:hypothetical protein [Candidatus Saccharimonadia bacterium]